MDNKSIKELPIFGVTFKEPQEITFYVKASCAQEAETKIRFQIASWLAMPDNTNVFPVEKDVNKIVIPGG